VRLHYRLVNVFTCPGDRLTGNPLCVFEDGSTLDDARMQALALQFNLSETTFLLPSDRADARVRIFTPSYEMPFAGHPTLGTAHVLRALRCLGDIVSLELTAGVIPVRADGGRWELQANPATTRAPRATVAEIAAALGLDAADVAGPPLWVDTGATQLIVPLASAEAVHRTCTDHDQLNAITADGPRAQAYVFAATGTSTLLARFFFSNGSSVLEDPATGSATANLGGWYLAQQSMLPLERDISQGEHAGRPSSLRLRIDADRRVFVSGEVLDLGSGWIDV
jgi:trans-2,3-dihydro-3-hydroxyanthranilate isomerase